MALAAGGSNNKEWQKAYTSRCILAISEIIPAFAESMKR